MHIHGNKVEWFRKPNLNHYFLYQHLKHLGEERDDLEKTEIQDGLAWVGPLKVIQSNPAEYRIVHYKMNTGQV